MADHSDNLSLLSQVSEVVVKSSDLGESSPPGNGGNG